MTEQQLDNSHIRLICPRKLAEMFPPFASEIWEISSPVTEREILECVARGELEDVRDPTNLKSWKHLRSRAAHMRRIAWLVVHGWGNSWIEVDVGIPALGYFPSWGITDGNHRFIAALVRGDRAIRASCGGQVDVIESLEV